MGTQILERVKKMTNEEFLLLLKREHACLESVAWVKQHGGTVEEMWWDCPRGDWLAWFIHKNQKLLFGEQGIAYMKWSETMAEMVKETAPQLSKSFDDFANGKIPYGKLLADGFAYGLTPDLSFPQNKWPVDKNSADIIRRYYPLFEKR